MARAEVEAEFRHQEWQRRNDEARVTLILDPAKWPGERRLCPREDGGCGMRVQFPPLRMQRTHDRETWLLKCPNCGKRRRIVVTTPKVRKLQRQARAELEKGTPGSACKRLFEIVRPQVEVATGS